MSKLARVVGCTIPITPITSPLREDSDFRVHGSGCRVQGSGFRVQGSGFVVQGAGFKGSGSRVQGSGFRVQGSGFRVYDPPPCHEATSIGQLSTFPPQGYLAHKKQPPSLGLP